MTLWDCCVVANDAWPPLGVFGVMPNPQNVHNVHVHGALIWKMTEFFLHSIIWPLKIICNQFQSCETILGTQKLGISWYTEVKNTPFVTIWVTLWITTFCEEKAKVFCITLQHLKEFYRFIAKLINKSHRPQWEFGQHFSNFGTKICKNRIGRRTPVGTVIDVKYS